LKFKELYKLALDVGQKADPRGEKQLKELLKSRKDAFDLLTEEDKKYFDSETLEIPYPDSRILAGDPDSEVEGILTGIDLEVPELLLADRLNEKGKNINTLVTHHPEGKALAQLYRVMAMQADVWHKFGVPINIGDMLMDKRMREVQRGLMPVNHNRAVDVAKMLGFNFMSAHTPADNLVTDFVQKHLDKNEPKKVGDVVGLLREIPEYGMAAKEGMGPTIITGDGSKRTGKVFVDMTGGTEGPEEAIGKLADAGIGTIVGMHFSEKLRKKAEESHINLIVAGHIASDAIGMNIFLDEVEKKGVTNITVTSGLTRVKRT
jgi:putative NIF3 family GTP cyclohydrolase 1 type 2